jgi:phosphoglycolate phosphatase
MIPRYSLVLFDLDGTLLNTAEGILQSVKAVIEKMGLPNVETIDKRFIGPPMQGFFQEVYDMQEEKSLDCRDMFRELYTCPEYLLMAEPYDGIISLIKDLHNVTKTAVVSYKRDDCTKALIERFGMVSSFDVVMGSDPKGNLTKADIIRNCIRSLGFEDLKAAVLVGDSKSDAVGAYDCGIDFIGVTYGYGYSSKAQIVDEGGVLAADTVDELRDYLLQN